MSERPNPRGQGDKAVAFRATLTAVGVLRDELYGLLLDIRKGKLTGAKSLVPVAADLRVALSVLMKEFERLEAIQNAEAGDDDEDRVDLTEARSEVGRRLDRIRAAQPAKEVP